jgi:hypothetical protein
MPRSKTRMEGGQANWATGRIFGITFLKECAAKIRLTEKSKDFSDGHNNEPAAQKHSFCIINNPFSIIAAQPVRVREQRMRTLQGARWRWPRESGVARQLHTSRSI